MQVWLNWASGALPFQSGLTCRFQKLLLLLKGSLDRYTPLWHPTPVLLPGKSHGRRSLVGCSPWGQEELDTTERLHFHFSLSCIGQGNGNSLQCSCLENPRDRGAWWGPSMGSHRVGHNWSDLAAAVVGFPDGSDGKESACNVGHLGLIPGQEDPMERGTATHSSILAWQILWTEATVHGNHKESDTTERLTHHTTKSFALKQWNLVHI